MWLIAFQSWQIILLIITTIYRPLYNFAWYNEINNHIYKDVGSWSCILDAVFGSKCLHWPCKPPAGRDAPLTGRICSVTLPPAGWPCVRQGQVETEHHQWSHREAASPLTRERNKPAGRWAGGFLQDLNAAQEARVSLWRREGFHLELEISLLVLVDVFLYLLIAAFVFQRRRLWQ